MGGFVSGLKCSSRLTSQVSVMGCGRDNVGLPFPVCCSIEGAFLRKTFRGDELIDFSVFGELSEGDVICGRSIGILGADDEGVMRGILDAPGTGDRDSLTRR